MRGWTSWAPQTRAGRTVAAVLTVIALVGAAIGLVAVLPSAQTCLQLGIASNYQYGGNLPNAVVDVPKLEDDGISTLREDVLWNVVQPTGPDEWDWDVYDRLFLVTARLGVRILPIVGYGTSWASAPLPLLSMPTSASGQDAYARFAAAVVERYGPGDTFWRSHADVPAKPIEAVELWNEPWFQATATPVTYVELVHRAGSAVHRTNPRVLVVANVDDRHIHGQDSSSPLWGASVLHYASALRGVVDRWAIHPYPRNDPHIPSADAIAQVAWLQEQLTIHDLPGHIWVTEIGFSTFAARSTESPALSFGRFTAAMTRTIGSHRVDAMWMFTSSRTNASTGPASFDYGFTLVAGGGSLSSALPAVDSAHCR